MFAPSELLAEKASSKEAFDLSSEGLEWYPFELKFEFSYFVFNNKLPIIECFSVMS
jgi:hypothetical protein